MLHLVSLFTLIARWGTNNLGDRSRCVCGVRLALVRFTEKVFVVGISRGFQQPVGTGKGSAQIHTYLGRPRMRLLLGFNLRVCRLGKAFEIRINVH
jgi:hypothetical protein